MWRFLLFLIGCPTFLSAQISDSLWQRQYRFLKTEKNIISNDSIGLASFRNYLQACRGKDSVIRILHVGDSHLQADYLTGRVRVHLQKRFGNAGRGLVSPYRVIKTNEPANYRFYGYGKWQGKRIVQKADSVPTGITGICARTKDTNAVLFLRVFDQPPHSYAFSRMHIIYENPRGPWVWEAMDENFCTMGTFTADSAHGFYKASSYISELKLPQHVSGVYLKANVADTTNLNEFRLFGVMLENDSAGVLYNTVGVNGAEFRHFAQNPYFREQLSFVAPKLAVISLGTNDAYPVRFDTAVFRSSIHELVLAVRSQSPGVSIILTTPGDSYRGRKYKNKNMILAGKIISDYCRQNGLAYWDLFSVMGGFNSISKWYSAGLTAKDKLHLNRKGYELQGDLFYNALIKSIDRAAE